MIEHDLDRIDILHGFGLRSLGITYSESNALGNGLKEDRDGGLTKFGRKAVERMNKVGLLIDCSHCGDQTTLDTVEWSQKPIVLSHIGARALWDSNRLAPDEVLVAVAEKGGVIGIECAPHTTLTPTHRTHSTRGVHGALRVCRAPRRHRSRRLRPGYRVRRSRRPAPHVYASALSSRTPGERERPDQEFDEVEYVEGLEKPHGGLAQHRAMAGEARVRRTKTSRR